MDVNFSPQWQPEPDPQNGVERLLLRAANDPSLHGKLLRKLWGSELIALMPYHPEMEGVHELTNGDTVPFMVCRDETGLFMPIFTSESVALFCVARHMPNAPVGLATIQGEALFSLVRGLRHPVLINSGMSQSLRLLPEAVDALVSGELRHSRAIVEVPREGIKLTPRPLNTIPGLVIDAVRSFCDRQRVAIAIYAFHGVNRHTGQPNPLEIRFILRLRRTDSDFYNDFYIMVAKLLPQDIVGSFAIVTPDNEVALDFLATCTPIWPVIPT
jgi:hypothetical protein